jgi:hypothetical protein
VGALLWALAPGPAAAQRGQMERSGPLGGDLRHVPADTIWRLERIERGLPASSSIEQGRALWELEEIRRDADRAGRAARDRDAAAGAGLLGADRDAVPDRRSLSDPAPVLGTGKQWVRIEGLLGAAEGSLAGGDRGRARALAEQARAGLRAVEAGLSRAQLADPQVQAASARLRTLAAGLGG